MSAKQTNAKIRNPNELDMVRVATYERLIRANLERVWENVLDWEHLPHLHSGSFGPIELIEAGDWGWRVYSSPDQSGTIELVVANRDSYVSRSYTGDRQTAEIWTTLAAQENGTAITVDFEIPDVPAAKASAIGERMLSLYTTLWDEDEAMMMQRQRRLDERRAGAAPHRDRQVEVTAESGQRFQLGGREYVLIANDEKLTAIPTVCPHLLGPLATGDIESGTITCPWHGYRFDLETGACIEPAGAPCKLPRRPTLEERHGKLIAAL